MGGVPYRVIGLIAKQGRTLGQSRDAQLFIPAQAYRRQFGCRYSINILVKARDGVEGLDAAVDEVAGRDARDPPCLVPAPPIPSGS